MLARGQPSSRWRRPGSRRRSSPGSQKERFLRPFTQAEVPGLLACFAFTEASGGANFDSDDPKAGVVTTARRDGDHYVINGVKHFATNGSGWEREGAQLYTVLARTDRGVGAKEGLSVIAIGIIVAAFDWTAALIGAACVGTARAAFDYALEFARSGKRLGSVPVIYHQSVGCLLADIKMRTEACRYLTWRACSYLDAHPRSGTEVAVMTKVYCSEQAVQCVYDGGNMGVRRRQLHGILCSPGYDSGLIAEDRKAHRPPVKGGSALGCNTRSTPWLALPHHVLGDARERDLDAELGELVSNARGARGPKE